VPCGGSNDCAIVADSTYSHLFGLPVAYVGVAGYFLILLFTLGSSFSALASRLLVVTTVLGAIASAALISISLFLIHASCRWCLASAGTMAALLLVSALRLRTRASASIWLLAPLSICSLAAAWFGAVRISSSAERNLLNQAVLREIPFSDLAPSRSPSRGDPKGQITLIEFADFACPACRDVEGRLTKLFSHTGGIRLVLRNLPQPYLGGHEASGYGAVCGEIANERGLFWQFAEQAFATPKNPTKADYDRILAGLGIRDSVEKRIADKNDPVVQLVNQDLALAHRLELRITPAFIVFSPELAPQVGTNLNLIEILRRPPILRYLRPLTK